MISNHTAIPFGEQVCYTLPTHPEDKALLESNLSAEVGEQTDGRGTNPALSFVPIRSSSSDKLRGCRGGAPACNGLRLAAYCMQSGYPSAP
jgi:hypothetical protein